MNRGMNKADKTLLLVLVCFLTALALHLQYRDSVLAAAFLFASEAALVGGIADWFAVTALFRKPLGFPYHTAILPRRRDAFIQASVTLVQKEFFSKRKIFHHLERLHIMPMLMGWLREPATESRLVMQLVNYLRDFLLTQEAGKHSSVLAAKARDALNAIEPEDFFALWGSWLQQTGKDKAFVKRLAQYWHKQAGTEEMRQNLQQMLEDYEAEKINDNPWAKLASFALQAVDLVNYGEAAQLMQKQILAMLEELGTEDSPLQQSLLGLFYEKSAELNHEPEFHQLVHELKDSLLRDLPLEPALEQIFANLREHFLQDKAMDVDPLAEHMPALRSRLEELISLEYQKTLQLMEEDAELRKVISSFLFDVIARSALHAQQLIGVIVRSVLSGLTDEQLNRLVYDKVEPDLLWIRMNGSIVGASIGLVLFILFKLVA